jgi:hypothetical protein
MVCFQAKIQFGKNVQGLRFQNVDIFYGHLEYFMDIWDILWPFVTFCVHLVHFSSFGITHQEKSGNPASDGFRRIELSVKNKKKIMS